MKIAIPTFATRVSPRFDCAQSVLVLTVDEQDTAERKELPSDGLAPHERINRLVELGVDTVICGSIDRWSVESLQSAGVTVYGWVSGQIEEALAALLCGDLDAEATVVGTGRCGCRRFPGDEAPDAGLGRGNRGRGGHCGRRGGGRQP